MTQAALIVENVGKAYAKYATELHRFARWFGLAGAPASEHWVIRHVAFRVDPGEAVALIGANGAGKSTVLKMITGTTRPTEGSVFVNGRISALLELGLGFNSELTGRENVVHAAGLMGIPQGRIDELMPKIEAFAEIGEYFDQPMRAYSSGMHMRVAFSVATAIRPDILIVDEALAVGDAYFVHKCFQKIREFRDAGTTLLIVSHDASAVQALCHRAILLDGGRMILDAPPQQVLDYYNALVAEKENRTIRTESSSTGQIATESGSGEAIIESVQLLDSEGRPLEYVDVGQPVTLRTRVKVAARIDSLVYGYMLRDRLGQQVFGTNTHHTGQVCSCLGPGDTVEFNARFPMSLGAGTYSVSVALASSDTHLVNNYQWRDLALVFTVANLNKPPFIGMAWLPPSIDVVMGPPAIRQ